MIVFLSVFLTVVLTACDTVTWTVGKTVNRAVGMAANMGLPMTVWEAAPGMVWGLTPPSGFSAISTLARTPPPLSHEMRQPTSRGAKGDLPRISSPIRIRIVAAISVEIPFL